MAINYALFENHLTSDPDDYAAKVQTNGTADLELIVQRMIDQGSTTTKADILAVLEDTIKACESYLLDGFRVDFGGMCRLSPSVSGVFNGAVDTFDPSRHRVDVSAAVGKRIRKTVREQASVAKVESILPSPSPLEYVDMASGETNNTITSGTIGTLNGHRLKFNPDGVGEGLFLIDDVGAEYKIEAIQKNKPAQLVFLVPATPPAGMEYRMEVRARLGDATSDRRMGRLEATLTKV
ncbi:MAG: hypothetical protein DRJ03_30290 [Chloroflexi bacterium]|nr:MAG: hypothetical protein DRJ03_30290 [Chloroflexota bacterium]